MAMTTGQKHEKPKGRPRTPEEQAAFITGFSTGINLTLEAIQENATAFLEAAAAEAERMRKEEEEKSKIVTPKIVTFGKE